MVGLRSLRGTTGRRASALVLAASLSCLTTLPLSPAASVPPPPQRQDLTKPLQYEVSVVLKLIHVYVTDKKGKPVEDLTLDDFTATDNGNPVKLTEFEKHVLEAPPEKAAAAGPTTEKGAPLAPILAAPSAPTVTRKFFLFFDFAFNNARGITKAKKAALHFLEAQVRPDDEVGVLTYSMFKGVTVHEYLTTDHEKIREVLDRIDQKAIAGRANEIEREYWLKAQEPGSADPLKAAAEGRNRDSEREEAKRIAEVFMLRLTSLAKALRYIPGQKHFILFSTGIPSSLIYGNQAGNPADLAGRSKFDPSDRVLRTQNEEMYREFAAASCIFYAFDTRESAMVVDLFAYDALTFGSGGRGPGRGTFRVQGMFQDSTNVFRDDKITGLNSLKGLTASTGGKYYSNINMYEKNLDQVQALTGTYYVLGYAISEREDGSFHEVKVAVKRKDCQVRAQSGYFNPKPFGELTKLEKELHLYDLALNERSLSRLPVSFPLTALAFGTGGTSGLEILAAIPGDVTARFSGQRVEYVALVFDAKNDIRDVRRLETDPRPRRGQAVVFTCGTSLAPGHYTCRLVIRDMETGLSAVSSTRAAVRAAPGQGLRLGTPLLLRDESGAAYLDAGTAKNKVAIPWGDAYEFDKTALAPAVGPVSKLTSRLIAVVPYAVAGTDEPDVVLSGRLINAVSGRAVPVALTLVGRAWHSAAETVSLEIPLGGLAPGKYLLYINAQDRASKTMASTQISLVISED